MIGESLNVLLERIFIDKLDGLLHKKADSARNMEDFLNLPEDYEAKFDDGKKHVRLPALASLLFTCSLFVNGCCVFN